MARKRKTLPKDFEEQLTTRSLDELIAVFDTCLLDARGGFQKGTALDFLDIPEELARWLVSQGLDVDAADYYDRSPLWQHASFGRDISVLLSLGADVDRPDRYGVRPLHAAAMREVSLRQLIAAGADVNALDEDERTPLMYALDRAANAELPALAAGARILIEAGATVPSDAQQRATAIGERFEFYRSAFDPGSVAEADAALQSLYELFGATPVTARVIHDGVSRIEVSADTDAELFEKLWDLLVPGSGRAASMQGEAVRIAGKVNDELLRNGGGNWDRDFRAIVDALGEYLSSGVTVGDAAELHTLVRSARTGHDDDVHQLCLWAARWVAANPDPLPVPSHSYRR